jgi:hypothetical protein
VEEGQLEGQLRTRRSPGVGGTSCAPVSCGGGKTSAAS